MKPNNEEKFIKDIYDSIKPSSSPVYKKIFSDINIAKSHIDKAVLASIQGIKSDQMKIIESISELKYTYTYKEPLPTWGRSKFSTEMIISRSCKIEPLKLQRKPYSKNVMVDEYLLDMDYSQEEMVQVHSLLDRVIKGIFMESHKMVTSISIRITAIVRSLLQWRYIKHMDQQAYNGFREVLANKLNIWLDRTKFPMGFVRCDQSEDYYSIFSTNCSYTNEEIASRLERGIGSHKYNIDPQQYSSAFIGATVRFIRYFNKDIAVSQEELIFSYLDYLETQLLISNRCYKSSRSIVPIPEEVRLHVSTAINPQYQIDFSGDIFIMKWL